MFSSLRLNCSSQVARACEDTNFSNIKYIDAPTNAGKHKNQRVCCMELRIMAPCKYNVLWGRTATKRTHNNVKTAGMGGISNTKMVVV